MNEVTKLEQDLEYIKKSFVVIGRIMNRIYETAKHGQDTDQTIENKDARLKMIQAEAAAWLGYDGQPPIAGIVELDK